MDNQTKIAITYKLDIGYSLPDLPLQIRAKAVIDGETYEFLHHESDLGIVQRAKKAIITSFAHLLAEKDGHVFGQGVPINLSPYIAKIEFSETNTHDKDEQN